MYGEEALDKSNVRRWMNRFKVGETSVENKLRSRRLVRVVTDNNRH